jgi:D-sedoheptulose 7-phosphate isomerase
MKDQIINTIIQSIQVKNHVLEDQILLESIEKCVEMIVDVYRNDGKVLLCGNGGSAADAQHLAAELSGRFYFNRPALFAEALHVNSSFVTAVSNDFGYDAVFERMIEAAGRKGDVLIAISTSGTSQGIVNAVLAAKKKGMIIIGLTGKTGGILKNNCDVLLNIPSEDTPRIQEAHILVGHILCEQVEKILFHN